ncbi:MAG: hypothetical protein ACPHL6_00540 [Rubripirellula sp.]
MVEISLPGDDQTVLEKANWTATNANNGSSPEQAHTEGAPVFDSQAITEEALASDSNGSSLGLAPPTASGFAENVPPSSDSPTVPGSGGVSWESEGTRRKRQLGLIVALSTLSLFICLAGFAWFVSNWKNEQTTSNLPTDPSVDTSESVDPGDTTEDVDTLDTKPSSDPELDSDSSSTKLPESTNNPPSETSDSIQSPDPTQGIPEQGNSEQGIPTEKPTVEQIPSQEAANPTIPSDLRPVSPIDEMTEPPADPASDKPDPEEDPQQDASGMQDLPPGLAQYTRFLLEEGDIEKPNLEAPPSMDDLNLEEATRELDNPITPLRPKEINIDAALAVKLAVNTDGYSLPKLALLISQITGVPIQIDWVSFDLGEKDLTQQHALPEGWTSAREILDAACHPFGAEIRLEESKVTITLSDTTFSVIREEIAALDDFRDDALSATNLLCSLLELETNENQLVTDAGTRQDQQVTVITIETLRRARGLASKVDDKFLSRWIGSPQNPSSEWVVPVQGTSFAQSDAPITVAEFISRLSDENKVQTLINWADFTARRVDPEYVFMPYSGGGSLEMFQHAFAKFGLEARQVDSNHWWIGQRSTYDRLPVITWTSPLSPDPENAQNELNSRLSQIVTDGFFRVAVDEKTRCGILVLPRYLAKQLPKITEGLVEVAP